ncbi:MAG: hypothetical protein HYY17_09335 [Planctomycetes bacterium]|nr:hypothetical protein [Planctomycetota bacterium]
MSQEKPSRADQLFGQIALKIGAVTRQRLTEALELQRCAKEHKPLGALLIELKWITDLELNRILAEQRKMLDAAAARGKAIREDNLFGKVALRLGFCTEPRLAECLALQEQLPHDRFMRLGDIMVIKGVLSVEQVRKILDTQQGLILYCPTCDTQYNLVLFKPGVSLQCYRCGSPLRVPARNTTDALDQVLYFDGEE